MKHIATSSLAISLLAGFSRAAEPLEHRLPHLRKPANPAITSTYTKSVAVCCNKCKAQFNANPKGYLSNIIAVSGQCPLSKSGQTLHHRC